MDDDDIDNLDYKPMSSFAETLPEGELKPCSVYVIEDCQKAMNSEDFQVALLPETVREVNRMAKSKLEDPSVTLLLGQFNITKAMLWAIILYTFDLSLIDYKAVKQSNFYYALNRMLRERNAKLLRQCAGFLYYLMTGLMRLPPFLNEDGVLYRGIAASGADRAKAKYHQGRSCHWSGLSSASPSLKGPLDFANSEGSGGLILRIRLLELPQISGARDIRPFSCFPDEDEILLLPNFRTFVTQRAKFDGDVGMDVIDLFEKDDEDTDVF